MIVSSLIKTKWGVFGCMKAKLPAGSVFNFCLELLSEPKVEGTGEDSHMLSASTDVAASIELIRVSTKRDLRMVHLLAV